METSRKTPKCEFVAHGTFVRATYTAGAHINGEDAQEHLRILAELAGGKKVGVLVDLRNVASQDRAARAAYAGEESLAFTRRCALLIGSPMARVIGSFFLGINKPLYPTRLFTSLKEAEAWVAAEGDS